MSKKVSTLVTEYIIGEIKKGTFKVGDKLFSERELMQMLKVGRSSIREALNSLVDMQVLEKRMGIGVFVKKTDVSNLINNQVISDLIDPQFSRELLEFRLMLEVEICGKAAQVATNEDFEKIESALEMHRDSIRFNKPSLESDELFHTAIVSAAKNRVLLKIYNYIANLLTSVKQELLLIEDKQNSLYYHEKIYEAIKNHQVEEARKIMREHLLNVEQRYEGMLAKMESDSEGKPN